MLQRSLAPAFVFSVALIIVPAASAQTAGQRGPSQPGQPRIALPDLTITSAKVTAKCGNGTVTADIVATVKNGDFNGLADLSKIPFNIVMDANWGSVLGESSLETAPPVKPVNPKAGGPKQLAHGEIWTTTMTITGIPKFKKGLPKPGQYSFRVTADPMKAVTETDETNNTMLAYASDPCVVH